MNPSTVRRKLAANQPVLAAKVNFMSPQAAAPRMIEGTTILG